jgi:NADH-quinone oxidoreductase subunit A
MLFASALNSSTAIVAYLALFAAIGFGFIFVNLLVGYFLRPHDPHDEKQEIYECGEPTIGSSFVQFDLRFYVVALVFIIFDVEVAFLFPWATVYGKATNLMHSKAAVVETVDNATVLAPSVEAVYRELGVRNPHLPMSPDGTVLDASAAEAAIRSNAHDLATLALVAGAIFFTVLFVGFAYEWKTGALDWVTSIRAQHETKRTQSFSAATKSTPQESVLST